MRRLKAISILFISALAYGQTSNSGNLGNVMETTFAAGAPTGA